MREHMRMFIAACFYYTGLVKLALWWMQRAGKRLIILNYHRASGGDLRHQLLGLRRHFRILHLEAALEELYAQGRDEVEPKDRRSLLALTFDDGYRDNYTHAFKLACELRVPITIFLIPGYIESGYSFWWLANERMLRHAQKDAVTIEGCRYCLNHLEKRKALIQAIDAHTRYATSVAEREQFLIATCKALAVSPSLTPEEELALPLTWSEVQEMDRSGWVSLGAHTMYHPNLAALTDPTEVQHEVEDCRALLEQHLGHPIHTFAYPFGMPENIGDTAPDMVKRAGYKWVVTTIPGFNTPQSDPYLLRRIWTNVDQHWLVMIVELSGVWGFFYRLRQMPIYFLRRLYELTFSFQRWFESAVRSPQ